MTYRWHHHGLPLSRWRSGHGWTPREAAAYIGIDESDYIFYEREGYTIRNVPLSPAVPTYPV